MFAFDQEVFVRHPKIRRLAAHCGAVGLITGLLAVTAPAASAAGTTTDLGVTATSYSGDVAVGGGRVFVAADDRIIVADTEGQLTGGVVTGLSGVRELALSADDTRLYAALTGSDEVAEIDTASLAVTRRIDLSAHPCPSTLALLGERLWVGHGCADGSGPGGVVGLDLSVAAPAPVAVGGGHGRGGQGHPPDHGRMTHRPCPIAGTALRHTGSRSRTAAACSAAGCSYFRASTWKSCSARMAGQSWGRCSAGRWGSWRTSCSQSVWSSSCRARSSGAVGSGWGTSHWARNAR